MARAWTNEEVEWVKDQVAEGRHPRTFIEEFNSKFLQDRSMDSFTGMMTRNRIDYSATQYTDGKDNTSANILILDIETAPIRAYTWGIWDQNIATSQIISDWYMLTWSAKWLFEDKVLSDRLTSKEAIEGNDKRIAQSIWELLDRADIVIAHNGVKFDIKKLNTRFLVHGIKKPMSYQVIDTLVQVRKHFSLTSNKLDYVNQVLGLNRKLDTNFGLWIRCMEGKVEALKEMEEYNRGDVEILEETYLKLRPWMTQHPNLGLYISEDVVSCPKCGSTKLTFDNKPYATQTSTYDMFRCEGCHGVGRNRKCNKRETPVKTVSSPK